MDRDDDMGRDGEGNALLLTQPIGRAVAPPSVTEWPPTDPAKSDKPGGVPADVVGPAVLPDGLIVYRVEIAHDPEERLCEDWEEDFVRTLGVLDWDGDRGHLSAPQNVALDKENERRSQLGEKYEQECEAFGAFLRARGAIAQLGKARDFPEHIARPDLTSFMVAPGDHLDAVSKLHEAQRFWVREVAAVSPAELLAFASNKRCWGLNPPARPDDDAVSFALRAAKAASSLEADAKLWTLAGGNIKTFERMRTTRRRGPEETEAPRFLVERLIPLGAVTLMVGSRKTGKSTLATQLAVTVASGGGDFCGFNVPVGACGGAVILVCGEDPQSVLVARLNAMDPEGRAFALDAIPMGASELDEILAHVGEMPDVSLLVLDPARKFITGHEDDSGAVSEFFAKLEKVALAKGCAVLVVHHPKKGGPFSSLADLQQAARGSGVFLDRPRVHLAMMLRGALTVMGIPCVNGAPQHNMLPGTMFEGEVSLTRDPTSMRHEPAKGAQYTSGEQPTLPAAGGQATDNNRVVAAVRRLTGEQERVNRTGGAGLYERQPPEIAGMSRRRVAAAVEAALTAGWLVNGPDGLSVP